MRLRWHPVDDWILSFTLNPPRHRQASQPHSLTASQPHSLTASQPRFCALSEPLKWWLLLDSALSKLVSSLLTPTNHCRQIAPALKAVIKFVIFSSHSVFQKNEKSWSQSLLKFILYCSVRCIVYTKRIFYKMDSLNVWKWRLFQAFAIGYTQYFKANLFYKNRLAE